MKHRPRSSRRPARFAAPLAAASAALCLAWPAAVSAQPARAVTAAYSTSQAVGEITLSVGPAVRTSAQGMPEMAVRGTKILPGDRLDTAEGGMLHVRFVDGAMVSLRPGSRLWVEDYRYDPQHVSQSLVRFKLEQGVARAISGAAAEGAKERFRLNTPLVAIGVRGTDFVVRTGPGATTAAVNQGAIVMAPFGTGCLAQALGPCGSPSAKLLSADMGQLAMEFRPQLAQPELKPLGTLASREALEPQNRPAPAGNGGPARSAQAATDDVVSAALVKEIVQAAPAPKVQEPPVAVAPAPGPQLPIAPLVPAAPPALQWGRWAEASSLPSDFSVSRAVASADRAVTVGNDDYILYRTEKGQTSLTPGLGAFDFSLTQSHAQYKLPGEAALAAAVQSGQLSIDFAAKRFSTSISVTSVPTGSVGIAGSGYIREDGIFFDRSINGQAIAGAAALDGKTAGYFFEKAVGAGTLSGITNWSTK